MLTLKDISLDLYIDEGLSVSFGEQHENALLFVENGIYNYADLERRIKSRDPKFQRDTFLRIIAVAKYNLKKVNNSGKAPSIYTFDTYSKYPELRDKLIRSDSFVTCDVLPIFTPYDHYSRALKNKVSKVNINYAKKHLGLISPNLRNAFVNTAPNLSSKRVQDIAYGIRFYEEQILRIVESNPNIMNYNGVVFYKDSREKEEIIRSILEDIILYINSLGENFIWGRVSAEYKLKLLNSLMRRCDGHIDLINNFVSLIRDYVTLQELEEGIIENETLKRFVIEPKKGKEGH